MLSFMVLDHNAYEVCLKKYPEELADELESLYANHIRRKYGAGSFR